MQIQTTTVLKGQSSGNLNILILYKTVPFAQPNPAGFKYQLSASQYMFITVFGGRSYIKGQCKEPQ
jgi:hypothetical protein